MRSSCSWVPAPRRDRDSSSSTSTASGCECSPSRRPSEAAVGRRRRTRMAKPGDNASLEVRFPSRPVLARSWRRSSRRRGSIEIEGSRTIFSRPGPFHEGNQLMPVTEPFLSGLTITGPFNVAAPATRQAAGAFSCVSRPNAARNRLRADDPDDAGRRAFRRPVSDADVRRC